MILSLIDKKILSPIAEVIFLPLSTATSKRLDPNCSFVTFNREVRYLVESGSHFFQIASLSHEINNKCFFHEIDRKKGF